MIETDRSSIASRVGLILEQAGEGRCEERTVVLHLIPGQLVEHCNLSILQRTNPLQDSASQGQLGAHSLVTLGKGLGCLPL